MTGHPTLEAGAADVLVASLARFAVSEDHVALRASLEA